MSHTPGPYKKVTYTYDDGSKATYIKQIEGRRLIVAQIIENTGNDEGNADLMAAAPDLLEACKVALIFCETAAAKVIDEEYNRLVVEPLREAIRKAEGNG